MTRVSTTAAPSEIPGLPDRGDFGDLYGLQPGELRELVVQEHHADKAGRHYDFRIGGPGVGLLSWAIPQGRLPEPGEKVLAVRQPVHTYEYRNFEGEIPSGYGKGRVSRVAANKVLITKVDPEEGKIAFTIADDRYPRRFVLFRPQGADWDEHNWLLVNVTPAEPLPYDKVSLPQVGENAFHELKDGEKYYYQPKIDGAHGLAALGNNALDVYSYRVSRVNSRPIVHTERMFFGRPSVPISHKHRGTILKGEIYGVRTLEDGSEEVIPPQELSAILNSALHSSLARQQAKNIDLRMMVFDIQKAGNQVVDPETTPYSTRLKLIRDVLEDLPPGKFMLVPYVTDRRAGMALWERIRSGQDP